MRRVFSTCLVAAVLLTGCTGADKIPEPAVPGPAILAFHQNGRMMFADASGRTWGGVAAQYPPQDIAWSADGTTLAWLDDSRLYIVEAATGSERSQPCPCAGLARLGDRFATVSGDGLALLLFDAAASATRVALRRPMPDARVIAGGRDQVAVAEPIPEERAAYRGQSALAAIDSLGRARLMIAGDSAVSISYGFTSPDGTRIATIETPSTGACSGTPGIFSLVNSGRNPRSERLVPADATFRGAVLADGRDITAISWAGDDIVVTFGPNECQSSHSNRFLTYALTGTTWHFVRAGVRAAGFGGQGRSYAIDLDTPTTGKLVLTSADGSLKEVGEGVTAFWATPAEQAAGQARTGTPEDPPITTTDRGHPVAATYLGLAARITAALDAGDTTTLAALCAACDAPTLKLVETPVGRDKLRKSLSTHPAADANSVTYPGLAVRSCLDTPDDADSCTAEQINDIGRLGLPSDYDINSSGQKFVAPISGSIRMTVDGAGAAQWTGQSRSAQNYRIESEDIPEAYFFMSSGGEYICGIDATKALCQGPTDPIPPRPASCGEGPEWGGGMSVTAAGVTDFICAGGVMFYPVGREPGKRDRLAAGQVIGALGFTCQAGTATVRCTHESTGHGFAIAPRTNERF